MAAGPPTAISEYYRGVLMRSRLETQTAHLLDRLGWKWKYEPFSVKLPSGLSYRPDFYIRQYRLVVECRGYHREFEDRQLEDFARQVPTETLAPEFPIDTYVVIGPEDCYLSQADPCEEGIITSPFTAYFTDGNGWAPNTFWSDGADASWLNASLEVAIAECKLYVTRDPTSEVKQNDRSEREWEIAAWDEASLARLCLHRHLSELSNILSSAGYRHIMTAWLRDLEDLRPDQPLNPVIAAALKVCGLEKQTFWRLYEAISGRMDREIVR